MTSHVRLFALLTGFLVYCQLVKAQITITSVPTNPICAGSTISVTYNSLQAGTLYAYLYDANSTDFGSPKQIQTIAVGNNLTITIPLASTQASGSYTIRLTNNTPSSTTYTNTSSVTITAAPPAPSASNVSYCQNAYSQSLSATASAGGTLNWYGAYPVGGVASSTPPTPPTSVVGTTIYYVNQTINGCEGPRTAISVTVKSIPAAPSLIYSTLLICQGSTAPSLVANPSIGGVLNWYTTSTGGTASAVAPIPPTSFVGVINYYVSQTVNGCEGPRAAISVTIFPLPTVPSVSSVTYCQGSQAAPLTAVGRNLLWYTDPTGGTPSYIPPTPSTSIVGTSNFYVSQSDYFCEGPRAVIKIIVNPNPMVSIDAIETILTPTHGSLTLTATSSVSTLYWSTAETTPGIAVSTAGIYSVTATAVNGCSATATVSISQSLLDVIYSVKSGAWDDPSVWSINQVPTSAYAVQLRHVINLPEGYSAQAGVLGYDTGGQLQTGIGSQLLLGSSD